MDSVSSVSWPYLASLSLLSAGAIATVPTFRRSWSGTLAFPLPTIYGFFRQTPLNDRVKAGPALLLSGYVMCLSGWCLLLVRPLGILLGVIWFLSFAAVVTIAKTGHPRLLIPPHLRDGRS